MPTRLGMGGRSNDDEKVILHRNGIRGAVRCAVGSLLVIGDSDLPNLLAHAHSALVLARLVLLDLHAAVVGSPRMGSGVGD